MEKTMCVCPICKTIKTKTVDGVTSMDVTYHTNQSNFKTVTVSISDNGMMMGGSGSNNYNFKVCVECVALAATETNGKIKQITAICDEIKIADEELKAKY